MACGTGFQFKNPVSGRDGKRTELFPPQMVSESMPIDLSQLTPQFEQTHDAANGSPWNMTLGGGPVLTTAIHAGHVIREDLHPWLAIGTKERLREEDPMTDYFLGIADNNIRANRSRFEFDLNRDAEKAVTTDPEDTWGLKIWDENLPQQAIDRSLSLHAQFYSQVGTLCDSLIAEHGKILILDLHSFNHMRDGKDGAPAPQEKNPDIDMGVTELNRAIYGDLVDTFAAKLRSVQVDGRTPDVRENKRFPDGGNFPEWLHARYGDAACVMTLEYKKIFMDEWGRETDILALQNLRQGLQLAIENAQPILQELNR